MASTTTQLINNNFGGIRRKDAYFSAEKITCSDCQNVELFFTKLNSGVGIRTAKGNSSETSTITKTPLNIYKYVDDEMSSIADNGVISGRTLIYYILDDNNNEIYYTLTRNTKEDLEVDSTPYFAFSDKERIVYTTKIRNDLTIDNKLFTDDEEIIGVFESEQNTQKNVYVYVETPDVDNTPGVGKLYRVNLTTRTKEQIVEVVEAEEEGEEDTIYGDLEKTGKCSATTYYNATQDIFVFSNGKGFIYDKIYSSEPASPDEHHTGDEVVSVHTKEHSTLADVEGGNVFGLGLVILFNRLWVFNGRTLWYSVQGDCEDFSTVDTEWATSAGLILTVKNITAIYAYLGSLAIFYKDSSVLLEQDTTTSFKLSDESPGGCASYNALAFHGTDLFFYDDTKKGVFSFKQIVIGDKTLGENIAFDIQDELMSIRSADLDSIRTLSVVTEDRNEVWFLIPIAEEGYSIVMIFDYIRGEWVKRKCQHINGMNIIHGNLYSFGKDIYREYVDNTFAGKYIEAFYICSMFNLGADNTMKITKFPPRLTVDGNEVSNFFVKYVKNYNYMKTPKTKEIKSKNNANVLIFDEDYWDSNKIYVPNSINAITKIPSATFKSLEITFYITDEEQSFAIKNIEFSKIKVKQV